MGLVECVKWSPTIIYENVVANSRFTSVGKSHFIATICSLYMQAYKSVVI